MNTLGKFLEEWDLEIIWTVLLAAVCVIGLVLATQQDADAGPGTPSPGGEDLPAAWAHRNCWPCASPGAGPAESLLPAERLKHGLADAV